MPETTQPNPPASRQVNTEEIDRLARPFIEKYGYKFVIIVAVDEDAQQFELTCAATTKQPHVWLNRAKQIGSLIKTTVQLWYSQGH